MSETRIKIKAKCLKKYDREIWELLSAELIKSSRIHDVEVQDKGNELRQTLDNFTSSESSSESSTKVP